MHRVEILLVNRLALQDYLNRQYGINHQFIYENHDELLKNLETGPIILPNGNSKYQLSSQLREQPLNIVMTKNDYVASGANESRYMVYRDRIEAIHKNIKDRGEHYLCLF